MKKGDKGKKVFGLIVILAIIVSVFGGAVSAEDLSGRLKQSVVDKAPSKDNTISDEEYGVVSAEDVSEGLKQNVADTKLFNPDVVNYLSADESMKYTSLTFTVYATREGLVGQRTANGHLIQSHDHFVALPSTKVLCSNGGQEFEVRVTYKEKSVVAPIWDVGPWNTKDDYWNPSLQRGMWNDLTQGKPEAQAAYQDGYNNSKDEGGRIVLNPAGIDLADGTFWDDLGMTDNDWVTVEFLWSPAVSCRDSSPYFTKGSNSGHPEYWNKYTYDGTAPGSYNGHTYIWTYVGGMTGNPSEPDCWAEFKPYLPQAGEYEVYACFYGDPLNSKKVPHTIYYNSGSATVTVNQYASEYFTWKEVKLGTWNFNAGADTRVVVTDATGEPYDGSTTLNVDTLKFVLSTTSEPPSLMLQT